ncbi:hypothetical protein HYX10_04565 [Candidatus Woesearchaeota archaeon]|nr:hypothetical protein [Candidatus Woesearchaeota archaeon]
MENADTESRKHSGNPDIKLATAILLVNAIIPGLGTVVVDVKKGMTQALLYISGFLAGTYGFTEPPLPEIMLAFLGVLMVIGSWGWAAVTSIKLVRHARLTS